MWLPQVIHGAEDFGVSSLATAKKWHNLLGVIFALKHGMVNPVVLCDPPLEEAHLRRGRESKSTTLLSKHTPTPASINSQRKDRVSVIIR